MKTKQLNFLLHFLILLLFLLLNGAISAQSEYRFEHINKSHGLSQGTINAIFEDINGLMWFGTNDGLNRYDGKRIEVFRRNHKIPNSLPNNNILCISQDKSERLWIGTNGNGLCYMDPVTGSFHSYRKVIDHHDSLFLGKNVFSLSYDSSRNLLWAGSERGVSGLDLSSGKIFYSIDFSRNMVDSLFVGNIYSLLAQPETVWIGTDIGGLLKLDLNNMSIQTIPIKGNHNSVFGKEHRGMILRIVSDKQGRIWISSYGDFLYELDLENNYLVNLPLPEHLKSRREHYLRGFDIVGDTALWCGTAGDGLYIINLRTHATTTILHNQSNSQGITSNSLKSIFTDSRGGVWVGDNGHGINYYYPVNKNIIHLSPVSNSLSGLTFRSVRSIYKDDDGLLWVGGYGGFNVFDKNLERIIVNSEVINAYIIHPDPVDRSALWIGIEGGGLRKIDRKTGQTRKIYTSITDGTLTGLYGTGVYSIKNRDEDELWLGTETALNIFNKTTGRSQSIYHKPTDKFSVPGGKIRVIFSDSKNRTWIGTLGGGLGYMKDNSFIFNNFRYDPNNSSSISSDIIYSVFESSTGQIYIGTDNGLNIYNEVNYTFRQISTADGLINDVVYGILEDDDGNIWLSTNEGISCYNPLTSLIKNYDHEDGLQANEFNSGAYLKDSDGYLYFGGINGVSIFKPSELHSNTEIPKVIFTSLRSANEVALIDPPITKAKEIRLNYSNQSITLEFAALNYYKPKKNQYAYRISGVHDRWIGLGNQNSIEIANLGYGVFIVEVIATNNDGVWNYEGSSLKIIIPPPYYAQWWFRILIIILVLSIIGGLFLLRIRNLALKKERLEKIIEERTKELKDANILLQEEIVTRIKTEQELLEVNKTKDRFFSIIAHDLKSPFTSLLGLSEMLHNEFESFEKDEIRELLAALHKSSEDLFNLLQNLLNWSMTQRKTLILSPEPIQINDAIKEVFQWFSAQAMQKAISLINSSKDDLLIEIDKESLYVILRNLVSNAIKFTPAGGEVSIRTTESDDAITITVADSGVGIPAEKINKLFRLDEKIQTSGTANERGTGLGLVLCYEFVRANGGTISVSSQPGMGTTFTINIPKKIST